jgi:hypothetical protein
MSNDAYCDGFRKVFRVGKCNNQILFMPFTDAQLATQMNVPDLDTWAATNQANQAQYMAAFIAYFDGIQTWIHANGGIDLFGWNNVIGLTYLNGTPVPSPVVNLGQRAAFDDAFNQVRAFINSPNFRLWQAAEAEKRLINVLNNMG